MNPPASDITRPRVVLLDLGGVLADLGDPVRSMGLTMQPERFWSIWLASPSVRAYESGQLGTPAFAQEMALELGLGSTDGFEARLAQWRLKPYPAVDNLVRAIQPDIHLALLSNTNELHWQQIQSRTTIFDVFDRLFLSFQTGRYKPDEAAFLQVVDHYRCKPGRVLFLDDSEKNVRAAARLGLRAHRAVGPAEVRHRLAMAGVLDG